MHQQKLDEDGLASSYLMLTFILPVTVYLVYTIFRRKTTFVCTCKFCLKKKPNTKTKQFFALSVMVLIISVLIKNIFTIKIQQKKLDFDPYEILNISMDCTEAEIKKNYRKLLKAFSKKLHKKETKKVAEEGMKKLNMAYTMIKDPKAIESFLRNTSTSELLIALPSFIVNFSTPFLIFYIGLLVVILPIYSFIRYKRSKKISATGTLFSSNENFLDEFDNLAESASVIMQQLFVLVGESQEFTNKKWLDCIPENMVLEDVLKVPVVTKSPGYLKLLFYLTRNLKKNEEIDFVSHTALNLIQAYKKIAVEKERASILENLIIFEKMVIQALPSFEYSLAQFPGVSQDQAYELACSMGDAKRTSDLEREHMKKILTDDDYKRAVHQMESIPNLTIQNIKAFTFEIDNVNEENTEKVFLTNPSKAVAKEGEFFLIPKDSSCNVSFDLVSLNPFPVSHSPFISDTIPNKWYVFAAINDRLVGGLIVLDQFDGKKSIQIGLPYSNGRFQVRIYVLSNAYFGNNLLASLNIKFI